MYQEGQEGIMMKDTHTSDGRIRHLSTYSHNKQDPCLWILQRLYQLILLEMGVLDSLSVGSHTLHSDISFSFGQEFCGRWYIGEEEENDDTPDDADAAEDDEDIHPAFEGAGGNVSNCVAQEATDHGCDAIGAVVCFEAEGLFSRGPPHALDSDQCVPGRDGVSVILPIMRMKPGFTTASKVPSRKRLVATPAKLTQAGVVISIIPQTRVTNFSDW
jgi:hypothetical protein